jgi:hypothetical protein
VSIVPGTAAMGCRGRGGCWEVGCGVEDDASGLSACLACCHVMEAALGGMWGGQPHLACFRNGRSGHECGGAGDPTELELLTLVGSSFLGSRCSNLIFLDIFKMTQAPF